jgi:glycosyltransferase involved in cell wall biosynthesis
MRFSLILATLRRTPELTRLLDSLCEQTHKDFELVVVDGGRDSGLGEVLQTYVGRLDWRYAGSAIGHSRALNLGLRHAQGDVVAFPDDDCWYDRTLLEQVAKQLVAHPEWAGVSGRSVTESGDPCHLRWDRRPGHISPRNVWRRSITISLFLRRHVTEDVKFDERVGVGAGTFWGAGEETDFVLQILGRGGRLQFEPAITVYHPEWNDDSYTAAVCAKARSYNRGFGRVLKKHYAPAFIAWQLTRPLGGLLLSALSLRIGKARYHWAIFAGRAEGWIYAPRKRGNRSPVVRWTKAHSMESAAESERRQRS